MNIFDFSNYCVIFLYCRMVKDFVSSNNIGQIKKLLRVLGQEFTLSQNQNSRKGGLIGLAATAIALSKVPAFFLVGLFVLSLVKCGGCTCKLCCLSCMYLLCRMAS